MILEVLCGAKTIPVKKTPQAAAESNFTVHSSGQNSVRRCSGATLVDAVLRSAAKAWSVAAKSGSLDYEAAPSPTVYIVACEKGQCATVR
jgi:hypothetical protein